MLAAAEAKRRKKTKASRNAVDQGQQTAIRSSPAAVHHHRCRYQHCHGKQQLVVPAPPRNGCRKQASTRIWRNSLSLVRKASYVHVSTSKVTLLPPQLSCMLLYG